MERGIENRCSKTRLWWELAYQISCAGDGKGNLLNGKCFEKLILRKHLLVTQEYLHSLVALDWS